MPRFRDPTKQVLSTRQTITMLASVLRVLFGIELEAHPIGERRRNAVGTPTVLGYVGKEHAVHALPFDMRREATSCGENSNERGKLVRECRATGLLVIRRGAPWLPSHRLRHLGVASISVAAPWRPLTTTWQ